MAEPKNENVNNENVNNENVKNGNVRNDNAKKVLRGSAVAIIIYISVSMLTTKYIYDSVFKRGTSDGPHSVTDDVEGIPVAMREYTYDSGDYTLKATHYSQLSESKGLIVFAPGFKSEVGQYQGVLDAFLEEGFDVFAFDPTGHGDSDGETSVGFPQIIRDLDATMKFINGNEDFHYDNIFLLGHSRGGYGVCCGLNSCKNITAVVSVNGMDTAMDAIMAYSTKYVGGIAYGNYPFLSVYQNMIFGSELSGASAVEEVNKSDVPVLIIQSQEDEEISVDKFSIYSHRDQFTSGNAEFLLYNKPGFNGHSSILYDAEGHVNYDVVNIRSDFFTKNADK